VKLWFYKGNAAWALPIKLCTGKYAHVELEIRPGVFFSSTLETGPRMATFGELCSRNMADWVVVDLGTVEPDDLIVWKAANMIIDSAAIYGIKPKYNREGIIYNFLLVPIIVQNPTQSFCSEVVATALSTILIFLNMVECELSPAGMSEWWDKYGPKWQVLRFKLNEGV
jgi:hypothetical protein